MRACGKRLGHGEPMVARPLWSSAGAQWAICSVARSNSSFLVESSKWPWTFAWNIMHNAEKSQCKKRKLPSTSKSSRFSPCIQLSAVPRHRAPFQSQQDRWSTQMCAERLPSSQLTSPWSSSTTAKSMIISVLWCYTPIPRYFCHWLWSTQQSRFSLPL